MFITIIHKNMENQEVYQPELEKVYPDTFQFSDSNEQPKKPCKTCGKKGLTKSNVKILFFGFATLFLTFYGLLSVVRDIYSLFTR